MAILIITTIGVITLPLMFAAAVFSIFKCSFLTNRVCAPPWTPVISTKKPKLTSTSRVTRGFQSKACRINTIQLLHCSPRGSAHSTGSGFLTHWPAPNSPQNTPDHRNDCVIAEFHRKKLTLYHTRGRKHFKSRDILYNVLLNKSEPLLAQT